MSDKCTKYNIIAFEVGDDGYVLHDYNCDKSEIGKVCDGSFGSEYNNDKRYNHLVFCSVSNAINTICKQICYTYKDENNNVISVPFSKDNIDPSHCLTRNVTINF